MSPESARHLALVKKGPDELAEFSAADYLQIAAAGRRTLRVEVVGSGVIDVVEGVLWAAQDDQGRGFEALMRILIDGGLAGTRSARCYAHAGGAGDRQMQVDVGNALLEAARRQDEQDRAARRGDPSAPSTDEEAMTVDDSMMAGWLLDDEDDQDLIAPDTADVVIDSLDSPRRAAEAEVERGIEALLTRDYPEALRAFSAALELGHDTPTIRANLARLAELGYHGDDEPSVEG